MKKIDEVAQPVGGDEKAFKAKHKIAVKDHPEGTKVPPVTTQKKKRLADYDTGKDEVAYEEVEDQFFSVTWRDLNGMDKREDGLTEEKAERLLSALKTVGASLVAVYEMTDAQMKKREDYVKGMKAKSQDLRNRYGKKWKDVMYAIATKNAMKEELTGAQHKIDANKNGKVDAHDFKLLRSKKKVKEEVEELDEVGGHSAQKPITHPPTRPTAKAEKKSATTTTVKEAGEVTPPKYPKMKSSSGGVNNYSLKKSRSETFNVPTEKDRALEMDENVRRQRINELKVAYKVAKEEVEELDEISKNLAAKAVHGFANRMDDAYYKGDRKAFSRAQNARNLAIAKHSGAPTAKVPATFGSKNEEAEQTNEAAVSNKSRKPMVAGGGDEGKRYELTLAKSKKAFPNVKHFTSDGHPDWEKHKSVAKEEVSPKATELIQKVKQMQEEKLKEEEAAKALAAELALTEVFKPGNLKLSDGNVILVTKEQAEPLNKLFHSLSEKNKAVMQEKLMRSRDTFSEILKFAKETV